MTERAIVILRLKDNIPEEKRIWQIKDNKLYQIKNNTSISYTCFDYVVDKKTNKQLFEAYFEKSVDEVCLGINLTIFAYGQTGSGKTHSMFGNEKEKGIIYYSLKKLLTKIKELKISFIEIYNEKIFDLIDPKRKVSLYNVFNEPNLTGNSVLRISKVEEIEELIKKCELNRKTSVTEYNQRSSRSHTFFEISFELNDKKVIFNLIDLAGSEKASSDLERRKEGSFINKSLLSLGTVINNLSNKDYTSFRESKLTRLLQPSMEGNSNLIALCLINPQEDCSDESVSTLNFASRVGKIRFTKKVEEISSAENDNFYLLCEKCKSTFLNKSDLPIKNSITDKSNQLNNQSNITDIKQTLEIKEENKFTEMKKQRTKLEMSVLEYKNTLQNDLINKQEEKNAIKEEIIVTKENVSEDFQEKTGVLEVTNIRSENDSPNKEPNTLNTNNEILYFSPSHEEPIDIFNIYFTDDSKTSYFNEITTLKKKGRIEEKVEYLTKKINLYQERVDELEKVVYDLISNEIDNNQKNMFKLEKKMFYCKNKILDNQYEDFFN